MTTELTVLAWSVVLGLLQILIAAGLVTQQRGIAWNLGNRDQTVKPATGAAARAQRASNNFLETYVLFVAGALAIVVAQKTSAHTALGAQIYVWARAASFPVYVAGIPYLRTAIYGVSLWGILQLVEPLLGF